MASDVTSVARTPMFDRYCRCSGDMLRSEDIDMSTSEPVIGESLGKSCAGWYETSTSTRTRLRR